MTTGPLVGWILFSLALAAAAFFAGLWHGERARRKDAQRLAAGRRVTPSPPAWVDGVQRSETREVPEVPTATEPPTHPPEALLDGPTREKMMADFTVNMGVDEETAERAIAEIQAAILGQAGLS